MNSIRVERSLFKTGIFIWATKLLYACQLKARWGVNHGSSPGKSSRCHVVLHDPRSGLSGNDLSQILGRRFHYSSLLCDVPAQRPVTALCPDLGRQRWSRKQHDVAYLSASRSSVPVEMTTSGSPRQFLELDLKLPFGYNAQRRRALARIILNPLL